LTKKPSASPQDVKRNTVSDNIQLIPVESLPTEYSLKHFQ